MERQPESSAWTESADQILDTLAVYCEQVNDSDTSTVVRSNDLSWVASRFPLLNFDLSRLIVSTRVSSLCTAEVRSGHPVASASLSWKSPGPGGHVEHRMR